MFSISVTQKLCKFFIKNSREAPRRMLAKSQMQALSLRINGFVHSFFIPQGQTVNRAYFCRHNEVFSKSFVRSFCKWSSPVEFSCEDWTEACKAFWVQQNVLYKWCAWGGKGMVRPRIEAKCRCQGCHPSCSRPRIEFLCLWSWEKAPSRCFPHSTVHGSP